MNGVTQASNLGNGRVFYRFVRLDIAVAEQIALDHAEVFGQFFNGLPGDARAHEKSGMGSRYRVMV